ncbi:MAG: hypothetical protein VW518_08120, partial [Burkholderiaceae bacterium]
SVLDAFSGDAVQGVTQFTQPMTAAMANGAQAVRTAQNNARVPTAPTPLAAPRLPVAAEPLPPPVPSAPQGALDAATQQAMRQEADSLGVQPPSLPLDPALVAQQDYGSGVPTATSRLSATPQADTVDALSGDVVPYRSADEEYAALAAATPENADAVLAATTDEEVSVRNRLASLSPSLRVPLEGLTNFGGSVLRSMIASSINSDNPLEGVVMEGEKRSFQDTSGFLEKWLTQVENVKNGASLNDAQRKEISAFTSKVYSSLVKEQKRIEVPF